MDELLQEFLSETGEHLDTVDRELVRFEQEPNNTDILRNIFRLVHTVKGTCGFIGLPRLEALTHAAESVMGQFRDGASVSSSAVTAILETIDQIKEIMAELTEKGFIAATPVQGWYWLNPSFVWNGDRLAFVKEYRKAQSKPKAEEKDTRTLDLFSDSLTGQTDPALPPAGALSQEQAVQQE